MSEQHKESPLSPTQTALPLRQSQLGKVKYSHYFILSAENNEKQNNRKLWSLGGLSPAGAYPLPHDSQTRPRNRGSGGRDEVIWSLHSLGWNSRVEGSHFKKATDCPSGS